MAYKPEQELRAESLAKIWGIIEMMCHAKGYDAEKLAAIGHASRTTMYADKASPGKMTFDRFLRYLSPLLSIDEVYAALLRAIADKERAA